MKLNTIIVDDEPLARLRLVNLLEDVPEVAVVFQCKTGQEAINKINKIEPDLVFLDIQLKDMTGFDVLEKIKIKPKVIFVTAFDNFALKAFDFFAFDYLLKPFKDERFYKSVYKLIDHYKNDTFDGFDEKIDHLISYIQTPNNQNASTNNKSVDRLPIKLGNKISFINTQKIKYISASGYYAEIFTEDKKHLLRESLSNLIEELNDEYFIRIHRSTIINLNYLTELINSSYGEIDAKMTDNKLFRISKSYKKDFLSKMGL
ncbi:MAG: LytTR family DNA-binding domain-containing protein [Flavobacteriaceae bacterium]|nr:LytTR family DNA-binding domain-containing protein [Flavobacteriaceae bacterium]